MLISLAVHAIFLCEQPVGSTDVFSNHPRLAWVFNRVAAVTSLSSLQQLIRSGPVNVGILCTEKVSIFRFGNRYP